MSIGPKLSHPMASVVTRRRQLAPTVGPAAAPAGVFIRTGSLASPGVRVVSGLVQRFGTLCFIADNAGDFGNKPCPRNGCVIEFGAFECYVATSSVCRYPRQVLVADDPPSHRAVRGRLIGSPASCVEVMTAGTSNAGAGKDPAGNGKSTPEARKAAAVAAEPSKSKRAGKPAYERPENSEPRTSPLQAALSKLAQPVDLAADPAQVRDELELQRLRILEQANEVARSQLEYEINQREYNLAHGLTPATAGPSKLGHVRSRGGRLQTEIN